ncbi:MAG: 4a-hydroxytetrahydrobiopterin dehydratase [Phycisphaerales bacterium]|nr:4a-hydroxytetrahydrobiopterin dehydratase [Phycisphaerales bacterium]
MRKLAEAEVERALQDLPEWGLVGESINRTYAFADFRAAMAFVNAVAESAERVQHHPDILVRYAKVTLTLSTHDANGITTRDFDFAREADRIAGS